MTFLKGQNYSDGEQVVGCPAIEVEESTALIIKTIKTSNQRGSARWLQPGLPPSMEQGFAGR